MIGRNNMNENCTEERLSFCNGPQFEEAEKAGTMFYTYRFPLCKKFVGMYGIENVPDYGEIVLTVDPAGVECKSYVYDAQGNEVEQHVWSE
jgi:hypothetical protein